MREGETYAPPGSGKFIMRIHSTLLTADGGTAWMLGHVLPEEEQEQRRNECGRGLLIMIPSYAT